MVVELKEKQEMLANKDIHEEQTYLENTRKSLKSEYEKAVLKAFSLIIKLLHNIRTNQTAVMRNQGIKLVESEKHSELDSIEKK
jgi:hypothetical protein